MKDVVFAAFFIIDDELYRDLRIAWPFGIRCVPAIPNHIACIIHHEIPF